MALKRKDRIFPGESILVSRSEYESVYRLEFEDGFGTMTSRTVMPGVTLIFNDFHTNHEFPGESRCPGMIEINHCRTGRYVCTMRDGRIVWLGPQDFAVSDMGRPPVRCCFGQKIYQGISLVVEPGVAERSLFQMLGEGAPRLTELFQCLLSPQSFLLLRSDPRIQHIFSEMYEVLEDGAMAYYRLKTAELMFFLYERHKAARSAEGGYHSRNMTDRVREMEARMTEDLRVRRSVSDLAQEYGVGISTVKKYFQQIYGESPYAHLKRRRMEEAAFLLTTTGQSIAQIAETVGYQNTSKFSAAFRDIYGQSPTQYRRTSELLWMSRNSSADGTVTMSHKAGRKRS